MSRERDVPDESGEANDAAASFAGAAGSRLGPYRILGLLGAGGMGVVYRARDDRLQRDVAIKVLPPTFLADESARRRFRKEALALAKLNHANIAAVYDVGEDHDTAYLVMECVAGESLAARLQRGRLDVSDAMQITAQIADALGEAHEHGVVHRDLKPANVMITPKGQVKVLDFGLAKLLARDGVSATESRIEPSAPAGTPLYMSPEQAFGEAVDHRTDLWSLGVLTYESLAGRTPFTGATDWALLNAVSQQTAPTLRSVRADIPVSVDSLVTRAMSKDLSARYQSAGELATDARAIVATASPNVSPRRAMSSGRRFVLASCAFFAGAGIVAVGRTVLHRRWVANDAPSAIAAALDAHLPLAASSLAARVSRYVPDDTNAANFVKSHMRTVQITSSPSGIPVAIQDYRSPDSAWVALGITPLDKAVIPNGYFRWRLSPAGTKPIVLAPLTDKVMRFSLDSVAKAAPGMVRVDASTYGDYIAFIGWIGPYRMPAFDIDKFEVTNREYQQFVDSGGYRDQKYWREPLIDAGKMVSWEDAIARFRDQSGRPGPATWTSGHYPEGKGDFPVTGISWYEASAYALFRGKVLPTVTQWHQAAPSDISAAITEVSNMSRSAPAAVGTFKGLGPYGTYDMAGNAREWALNTSSDGARFILGGSWSSPAYLYDELESLPPFDRSNSNGVRCVRNYGPLPVEATQTIHMLKRDFASFTPASDAVFKAYQLMYSYDATPLNVRNEGVVKETADWRLEKVSFDAAYGHERMAAFLFLPTHVKPPFQAVVFSPSARVLFIRSSERLGDQEFFDYIVQSGRAVVYPIFQDTYERRLRGVMPGAAKDLELVTQRSKDLQRTLDFLQTRADIDTSRIGFLGVSMGAAEGVIYTTLAQKRLRTAVFLDGGFFLDKAGAGGDQADFAPRLKLPVLMVNGRYDATFSYDESQLPLFRMLGTPAADKKHRVLETAHDVTSSRSELTHEVLGWLDKYLGRVQ